MECLGSKAECPKSLRYLWALSLHSLHISGLSYFTVSMGRSSPIPLDVRIWHHQGSSFYWDQMKGSLINKGKPENSHPVLPIVCELWLLLTPSLWKGDAEGHEDKCLLHMMGLKWFLKFKYAILSLGSNWTVIVGHVCFLRLQQMTA